MDSLLKQHVSFVQRLRTSHTNVSIVEVIQMLDDIVQFLNTTPNQTNGLHVLTIICHDFASINVLKLFDNKTIMQHQFFLLIQRTLEMFLTKATFITMTKEDEQCWYEISHLVVQLCLFNNHQLFSSSDENSINQISYENIFLTKSFFERFTRIILSDLILNDYQPYHIKYKVLNHLLYLSTEVLNINHHLLYDSIVQCLSSHLYLNVFETIDFQQSRINPKQYFLLYQCPQFIQVHSHQHLNEISNSSCQLLLENTSKIFQQHLLLFSLEDKVENRQGKVQAISWHIELLNHLALTPTTRKYFSQGMY
ncbi:unnamed protein product [Adineta steineri]|uniref:Uncharacterized protein n=1 Tax=Adineta steineri TaxID=433720 RepID=A0A815PGS2_9BILA|nr:unnamed protein product [Adineta steineri]CAF1448691.1 unnamed protein product [Adineta steineri]